MRSVPSLRNLIPEENNMNKTLRSLLLSAMLAALPVAAVMANETPTLRMLIGGVLIIVAIVVASSLGKRAPSEKTVLAANSQ